MGAKQLQCMSRVCMGGKQLSRVYIMHAWSKTADLVYILHGGRTARVSIIYIDHGIPDLSTLTIW
jgi:hypothetical protein